MSTPLTLAVCGRKKRVASVVPGWTPDAPMAPRSRTLLIQLHLGKNGSSEITYDTLSFGYQTVLKSLPKALLSSARRPPLMKSRSLNPNCCSMNPPTVADTVVLSRTVGMAAPVTVVAPPARFSPSATLRSFLVLKYCPPRVVRDVSVGLRVNDAVPLTSSVYWK